jgi:uncharacterized membrane-anchored protein
MSDRFSIGRNAPSGASGSTSTTDETISKLTTYIEIMKSTKSTYSIHTEVQLAQEIRRYRHLAAMYPDDQSVTDRIDELEDKLAHRLEELTCMAFESLYS